MERTIMKKQAFLQNSSTPSPLGFHKNSQTISKIVKPKIRIIHIFAPEIIKTDVENFRELVQRLTGKPSLENCHPTKKRMETTPRKEESSRARKPVEAATPVTGMELMSRHGFHSSSPSEIWGGANSGGRGFLGSFHEFEEDGFMAELNEYPSIPLLPLEAS